ncbi:MAG: hypothetical protein SWQ30_12640 [Thermodesulfobacteriota bacterium]|nr:hypothetical protein [Thermodesulfobacteriota bacterium]
MTSQKLRNVLRLIADNLTQEGIPYSLIGAMALSLYGISRFTADIDLLTEGRFWYQISPIMEKLGYTCHQKTGAFAQFDSEMGVYGKIDFMFVDTPDGKEILARGIVVCDELIGTHRVVQPTDYIVLKLMAIANNPSRSQKDEADILAVLDLYRNRLVPDRFESLDKERVCLFAGRFGIRRMAEEYFQKIFGASHHPGEYTL